MTRPTTDTADLSDTALDRCGTDDDTLHQADRVAGSRAGTRPAIAEFKPHTITDLSAYKLVRVDADGTRHYKSREHALMEEEATKCIDLLGKVAEKLPESSIKAALYVAVNAFDSRMRGDGSGEPFPIGYVLVGMVLLVLGFALGVIVGGVR
jgi:hypothetical protein